MLVIPATVGKGQATMRTWPWILNGFLSFTAFLSLALTYRNWRRYCDFIHFCHYHFQPRLGTSGFLRHLCKAVVFLQCIFFFAILYVEVRCFAAKTHVLSLSSTLWYKHFSKSNELYSLVTFFAISVARIGYTKLYPVSTHFFYASLWSQTFEFYTSAKREPGCFLPIFFPTKLLPVAVGTLFFPTSCLDRNGVKQNLERFCLKESINLVELLGLIPSSSSSLQRFQTQQIDPFKTGQTPVLEFLGEQLLHDAEKKPSKGSFSTFTTKTHQSLEVISLGVIPCSVVEKVRGYSSINSASRPVGSKVHAHPWSHRSIPGGMVESYGNSAAGGFFPNPKFQKLWKTVKMGKNLNPQLFGVKMEKISELPPPNFIHQKLKQHQKWHKNLRSWGAPRPSWLSPSPSRRSGNESMVPFAPKPGASWWVGPDLHQIWKRHFRKRSHGTHLSREVRKIIDSKVPLKGDMLVPRRVGPFNRLFHFQTNSNFKTLAQVSSIANGTFQCVLPMPHTTATSQNVEKN